MEEHEHLFTDSFLGTVFYFIAATDADVPIEILVPVFSNREERQ